MINYRVFLSFRGPDTFNNLASYLHYRLTSAGITTFLDREEIEFGQNISDEFINAIQNSDICVPIFSLDFASSVACLTEVAKMVELRKEIRPIFFFVEPKIVKHQGGTYATSFQEHKRKNRNPEPIIQAWRNALKEIGGISGPEFKNAALETSLEDALEKIGGIVKAALKIIGVRKGPENTKAALEAALAETGGPFYTDLFDGFQKLDAFICDIWKLSRGIVEEDVTRNLVGIDRDVPEMMRKLGFYYQNGVPKRLPITGRRVLVVRGMPGVGKTTLAKVVFHKIKHFFQGSRGGCSFLEDVRHEFARAGGLSLQNRLIRELKGGGLCLEVKSSTEGTAAIPNMFHKKRVLILLDDVDVDDDDVVAEKPTWFGEGSVIILTTRKRHVIDFYRNQGPEQNQEVYENLSSDITCAVEYLPLSIEMAGRHLREKSYDHWKETLAALRRRPKECVRIILKKHLDSLSDYQNARNIFLDIACFFTGVEMTIPRYMWTALEWEPRENVDLLENMSLLRKGEENEFLMHNQLKLLGRQLVIDENPDNPEGRSRLWDHQDVQTMLHQMRYWQGTNKVKALRVASNFNQDGDALFDRLWNLRFLELDNVDISGGRENILPNLKWLDWCGCKNNGQLFAFGMEGLVILNLSSSPIQLTLQQWRQLMQRAPRLEVLSLKGCTWAQASMEIPASRLLKCLILEGCLHLELNTANSNFENLVSFNMKGCKWVNDLPRALSSMTALKELLLDGTSIKTLQFEEGALPVLETLSARDCEELREVTDSIGFLKNLKKLFLRGCNQLNTLPHVFGELGQLEEMDLSDTLISELPPCVKHCERLQVLKMACTFVEEFPEAIEALKELKELDFTCASLKGICNITRLFSLRILRLKGTEISRVLIRDATQFCLHILELDPGVDEFIWIARSED
ncbi:disease resistance protein RPV1-like [Rhodamnia argentea]|uniref:Disease resistance protein RPV1-like n=1 Tax=Rhodamnia argentea TaxID=178133 RepID=A0ABM3H630_9MYRT|nr:disease resistance protein RPV1-like [Rhodamnia argentea]